MKVQVLPTILEKEIEKVESKIAKVAGLVEKVQIDIIDGKLAENKTVEVQELADLKTEMLMEVHLLVEEPVEWVEECAAIEAVGVIGQVELMEDQSEFIKKVKEMGMRAGLGLDLKTGVDFLEEEAIQTAEEILLMAVPMGFAGQKFDRKVLEKVKILRQEWGFEGDIWVDGGVKETTIKDCVEAGANLLAVNSALWGDEKVEERLKELQRLAEGETKV